MKRPVVLGIESTAHTMGIGIVREGKIVANERCAYKPKKEGIMPRKAAEHISNSLGKVLFTALNRANTSLYEVDAVAFSQGPGIGAPLKIGCVAARMLSLIAKKPLVGVNHCVAHVEIAKDYASFKDPLAVYASGGNTQIIVRIGNRYHVLGETLDIGVGNLLDTVARAMGAVLPSGRFIEELAKNGSYIEMPYVVKGMDFSFSGLLTDAVKKLGKYEKEDIAFSLQEHAFSMITEAAERALHLTGKKEVVACGGVAQNARFQEMLLKMCEENNVFFSAPPPELTGDNGAMIAYTGASMFSKGITTPFRKAVAIQKYRIDEVVLWY
ncbi:MAG: KEOPS complex N(6)-L-threonylcarbamoyladenine synthase Kae1 [Candidatus Micrarchaeia archaeon]